jgi:predicted small lipoprotein YifL
MIKHTQILTVLAMTSLLTLTACGGSDGPAAPPPAAAPVPPPTPVASTIKVDFQTGIDGWTAGVSDYTDETAPTATGYGWSALPSSLPGKRGYYLASRNNSDDVLTFVKHQYTGFVAGAKYKLTFELNYATDAAAGCFGVGGSRGESVYLVAAAGTDEPKVVKGSDGYYKLNLDRGNQAAAGPQGVVLGTQGVEGLSCDGGTWAAATRSSTDAITVTADKEGKLWVVLGTDSAFESANALYLLGATINVKPL